MIVGERSDLDSLDVEHLCAAFADAVGYLRNGDFSDAYLAGKRMARAAEICSNIRDSETRKRAYALSDAVNDAAFYVLWHRHHGDASR